MSTETITPDAHATQTASTIVSGEQQAAVTPTEPVERTTEQVLYDNKSETPPPTEETKQEEAKPEDAIVPEKYELKLPENSLLSKEVINDISAYAKAEKLTNAQAQKLLERESTAVNNYHSKLREDMQSQTQNWFEDVKNDKELGGQNFNQTAELAKRVMDQFGDDQLKKELNETGLGNHPGLIRLLVKIGKNMSEDKFVAGQNHTGSAMSAAEVLYGKSN